MLTPKQRIMLTFVIGYDIGKGICCGANAKNPTQLLILAKTNEADLTQEDKKTLIYAINYAIDNHIAEQSEFKKEHFTDLIAALQEPTPPPPKKRTEGWQRPLQSRKFHYYVDGRSLCGGWGFPDYSSLDVDTGNEEAGKEDCTACFRKLVKRRAERGVKKIE